MSVRTRRFGQLLALVMFIVGLVSLVPRPAAAHYNGYYWAYNTIAVNVCNHPFPNAAAEATRIYDLTDLTGRTVCVAYNDQRASVINFQWFDDPFDTRAAFISLYRHVPYGWQPGTYLVDCFTRDANQNVTGLSGECNTTDKRATFGIITINRAALPGDDEATKMTIMHEIGHILGMAHTPCWNADGSRYPSIMGAAPNGCPYKPYFSGLGAHDISHINAWY